MCGIAGIMTASGGPPDRKALQAMQRALAHRGPDGEGMRLERNVGMVQTRLAIIDLETGDQPFTVDWRVGPPQSGAYGRGRGAR